MGNDVTSFRRRISRTLPRVLKERLVRDGIEQSDKELNRQFRLHLHRGIGYLASPNTIRSVADLIRLPFGEN